MRFAQLARKLKVSQEELTKYLKKEHNIEVLEGPNTKIDDEIVDQAKTDYNYVSAIELKKMEIQEAANKVEKQLEDVNEEAKAIEDALVAVDEEPESVSIENQDKQKQVEVLDEVIASVENNPIEEKVVTASNEEAETVEEDIDIVESVEIWDSPVQVSTPPSPMTTSPLRLPPSHV